MSADFRLGSYVLRELYSTLNSQILTVKVAYLMIHFMYLSKFRSVSRRDCIEELG